MPNIEEQDLDLPIYGAEKIGRAAGVVDANGEVDLRRTFYLLGKGYLPASKVGRVWVSTPRRLRSVATGAAAATEVA